MCKWRGTRIRARRYITPGTGRTNGCPRSLRSNRSSDTRRPCDARPSSSDVGRVATVVTDGRQELCDGADQRVVRTGLMDMNTMDWDEESCAASLLGDCRSSDGPTSRDGGPSSRTPPRVAVLPVYAVMALYARGCYQLGQAAIRIGQRTMLVLAPCDLHRPPGRQKSGASGRLLQTGGSHDGAKPVYCLLGVDLCVLARERCGFGLVIGRVNERVRVGPTNRQIGRVRGVHDRRTAARTPQPPGRTWRPLRHNGRHRLRPPDRGGRRFGRFRRGLLDTCVPRPCDRVHGRIPLRVRQRAPATRGRMWVPCCGRLIGRGDLRINLRSSTHRKQRWPPLVEITTVGLQSTNRSARPHNRHFDIVAYSTRSDNRDQVR